MNDPQIREYMQHLQQQKRSGGRGAEGEEDAGDFGFGTAQQQQQQQHKKAEAADQSLPPGLLGLWLAVPTPLKVLFLSFVAYRFYATGVLQMLMGSEDDDEAEYYWQNDGY